VNFAEDGDGVDGRTVPAPVPELLLTLMYCDYCARLDGLHHLDVTPTHVLLATYKPYQTVTLVLCLDVSYRSRRRY